MSPKAVFCIFFACLTLFLASTARADDQPSVYDVLQEYGFPVGILPKGVTSYELDRSTGKFTVHFNKTCSFTISGYNIRYKTKVTGTISKGSLKDLSGVQVKVLFFWINITSVTIEGNQLSFSVGIASADFPLDNFYDSPQCGCGFDCVNVLEERNSAKLNLKRLSTS